MTGTSGDDDIAVFGDVWRVELDTNFLIEDPATPGITLEGGDGVDDLLVARAMTISREVKVLTVCCILTPKVLRLVSLTIKLRR